jgi:hypothetical protein
MGRFRHLSSKGKLLVRQREIAFFRESEGGIPISFPKKAAQIRKVTMLTAPASVLRRAGDAAAKLLRLRQRGVHLLLITRIVR